jgi:hypothetical protein
LDILSEKKSDPIIMKGKDEQGTKEEGIHTQMTKELQGSAKEKNTYKEKKGREKSQEKSELCEKNEGCQNIVEEALAQAKRPRRLPTNRSEDFLWVAPKKGCKQ